jgi:uracil-DNA glycosylase family 4
VTRRRSSYRSLASLQRDNRGCRACAEAGFRIESRPVLEGRAGQLAYILGQAPGVIEGDQGRPWRGRAGQTLRRWLGLDEDEFYATFYCASVTRCYPGRAAAGGGDRTPTAREQDLCSFWREWELRLLGPRLIVPVGGLAIRRLLGVASLDGSVGRRFAHGDAAAIPLPHPSGVSRWMNEAPNQRRVRKAVALIHAELQALDT